MAEGFDDFAGVGEVAEQVFVEAFVAKLAVEALDEGILARFSRRNKAVADLVVVAPALERDTGKFWSVVGQERGRPAAEFNQLVEDPGHPDASPNPTATVVPINKTVRMAGGIGKSKRQLSRYGCCRQ